MIHRPIIDIDEAESNLGLQRKGGGSIAKNHRISRYEMST